MLTTIAAVIVGIYCNQCRSYSCAHQTAYRPVAVAAPYVAPVAYNGHYNQGYTNFVGFIATEDLSPYSAVVGIRERQAKFSTEASREQKDLDGRFAAIETSLKQLHAKLGEQAPALQVPPPPPPEPQAKPETETPLLPGAGPGDLKGKATLILREKCAECHTGQSSKKKFKIFEDDGSLAQLSPKAKLKIDSRVYRSSMPPPPATMDAEDYSLLRAWISQDSKAIEAALN